MIALEGPDIYGVALSGAGPSVIALVRNSNPAVAASIEAIFARSGISSRSFDLAIAGDGLRTSAIASA
jgi:homoserine kinase